MNWFDADKVLPKTDDYYLTQIWISSVNQHFNSCEFSVEYFNGKSFGNLPFEEWYKGELMENRKVLWWSVIPRVPTNEERAADAAVEKYEERR